jgi:hypothetical protein
MKYVREKKTGNSLSMLFVRQLTGEVKWTNSMINLILTWEINRYILIIFIYELVIQFLQNRCSFASVFGTLCIFYRAGDSRIVMGSGFENLPKIIPAGSARKTQTSRGISQSLRSDSWHSRQNSALINAKQNKKPTVLCKMCKGF